MGGRTEASPGRVATSTWQTLPGLPCACSKGHISHGPLSLGPREPRTHTQIGTLRVHYGIHKWFTVGTWGPWQLDPRDGCDPRLGESPGSIPGVCVPTVAASGPSCADPSVDRPLADGSRLSDGVPGVDLWAERTLGVAERDSDAHSPWNVFIEAPVPPRSMVSRGRPEPRRGPALCPESSGQLAGPDPPQAWPTPTPTPLP